MNGVPRKENLEAILIDVNRFINIDNHRQEYAGHFENLKNTIFSKLRQLEPFGYLFNGYQLGGSYGDNLKVGMPNEFDLVFHIKFPENSLIQVKKDHNMPGNVHLDFTRVLQKISKEKQHEINLRKLKAWLDNKNYLLVEKFQSYIQSCFTNVLSDMQKRITFNGNMAQLRYTREGPAHTIHVVGNNSGMKYSVDFVPGILLNASQSVMPTHVGQWEAIPKPANKYQPDYTSFRSSFYRQEKKILRNNLNLKNVLRMMKKFRDSHDNMNKMKSYYIKTLFQWKAKEETQNYWRKSLTEIIIDMFKAMEESLRIKKLRFFWDERLDMYSTFTPRLAREMLSCVESARETLELAARDLTPSLQRRAYCIFLKSNERLPRNVEIMDQTKNICKDSVKAEQQKSSCSIS